ncbi:MAG TPA: diguanylate cyclase [Dokdonella sp.]|uniref:sensor domain-containing diguanylate cyclase n=1 Tax=Dokdonella sp. TaxID=2291710 RepID=UPI002D804636|nr:diguanylate cyclase [Dokdonella sp.]HET9033230.1 diguanylate cyclase [Dokdonella sp.]
MSAFPPAIAVANDTSPVRTKAQRLLPQRLHRFRTLGMGLASFPLAAVFSELGSSWIAWAWMLLICFVWPQLAYVVARRSADPYLAERRNLIVDSAIAGACLPIMHFNLLPSAVLISVTTADKVNSGVRRLWLYSLPGMFMAPILVGALIGFRFDLHSSTFVIACSLPLMIIHVLAVSMNSNRLVRRMQMQNLKLETLSRIDSMTGLLGRSHWESQAESILARSNTAQPGVLMILDIDQFKEINDRFGHATGDDVLCAIADVVRDNLPDGSHAGRWGGDEFVIVMSLDADRAHAVAERIRNAVAALHFPATGDLRCTLSIGLAEAPAGTIDLRSWLELADGALYRAKHGGRNQAVRV